jgi:diguanylate cyclase (GGDEF)-like protein
VAKISELLKAVNHMVRPRRHPSTSIGRRISNLVSLSVLSTCVAVAVLLALFSFYRSVQSAKEQISGVAYVLASTVGKPLKDHDQQKVRSTLTSVPRLPNIKAAVVLDAKGNLFASMGSATYLEGNVAASDQSTWAVLRSRTIATSVPIISGGVEQGQLVVIADVQNLWNTFLLALAISLAAACAASGLGLLLARSLQRKIVQPLSTITDTIRNIRDSRDFRARVNHQSNDETGILADSFNSLMQDIRSRDAVLEKVAYYDTLTGLTNRAGSQQKISALIDAGRGAVVLLDIDDFREINDALGHSLGNAVLMDVAARLHEAAATHASPSRMGGDEFAVTFVGVSTADAAIREAAKLVAAFYEPLKILGHEIHVTLSIGIALCPDHGTEASDLIRRADLALAEAKRSGKGRTVIFRGELEERIQERNELVSGLRVGLENGEIHVHYQPQVDLVTGKVLGFEALARWSHPLRGNISPAVFVPVAERAGLIPEIGLHVLRQSCIQANEWFKAGKGPYQVAVNVSAAQLVQAEFLRDVQEVLSETGLPPPLLCLELTESVFLGRSVGSVRHMFNDLKKMGIELALDDFGTGYSSLSYLEGLPFDKVKIDRAFVNGVHHSAKKMALLKGIISLSHSLNMRVVAEGAETQHDLDSLRRLNADTVQGYVYAKPTDARQALIRAEEISSTGEIAKSA